jgi:hypothetical protein
VKRGTPRHPKIQHLCELLKVKLATAVGYLELLWHFCAEFAPQGDLGKFSDARIEAGVHWHGAAGRLVAALIESRWVDRNPIHRLVVHDWEHHADDAVRKRLTRGALPFLPVTEKVTGQRQTSADNGGLPVPVPSPLPSPLPEPEPQPSPEQLRARPPVASDMDRQSSPQFERWWFAWVEGTGRGQGKDSAARWWVSLVHVGDEAAVMACTARYIASDDVSRGVICNPDTFLQKQAKDKWRGTWPAPRGRQQPSRQQEAVDAFKSA